MNETVVTAHPNSPSINKIELATVDSVEYPVNQNNIMFFYTSKDTSIDNTINFTTSSSSELIACQAMATTHTDMTETSKMSIPINDETLLSYDLSLQGQSDKLPLVQTEITQHFTDELMPQTPIINNVTLQEQSNRQDTLEREMIEHQLEDKILWPPSIATPEIMTLISNKTSDLIEPIASTSSNEVVQSPLSSESPSPSQKKNKDSKKRKNKKVILENTKQTNEIGEAALKKKRINKKKSKRGLENLVKVIQRKMELKHLQRKLNLIHAWAKNVETTYKLLKVNYLRKIIAADVNPSTPFNKTKESTITSVVNFLKALPAVPSHYCRKSSSRVYLPSEFKNLSNLYQIYKKSYLERGIDIVSERVLRSIFNERFNIGFHVPRKDKCVKCLTFGQNKDKPEIEEQRKQHEKEKIESYERFKAHQNIHKTDPSTLCASFDLQKVLNTPYGESMLLFYSRKLAVYNFCVYESGTRKVYTFYWDEANGKRGANEIATILNKYIHIVDKRGTIKNLLLYCDCCPGQNRNRIIMSMLHTTLQILNNIETIQQNFLLTGHTYMPVDSVHAVIERNLKKNMIYAPSQWYTVFATARQDPEPYEVELLRYKYFNKWDVVGEKYFKGNLTGKISKMQVQQKSRNNPPACYKSQLHISKAKYDDLIKLCQNKVIPEIFHNEYHLLTSSNNIKDSLPESDIEDDNNSDN
ncbi:hypothetical protein ACJJTC_018048 [Scirpophaga incertulas]